MVQRGNSFSVKYNYEDDCGISVQHWESYKSKLEAVQRKAIIDSLQENRDNAKIQQLATEYKIMRLELRHKKKNSNIRNMNMTPRKTDNLTKSFAEFAHIWLPIHARNKQLTPNSYDSMNRSIRMHINPYFRDKPLSTFTVHDIDEFLSHLSRKKCAGSKSYNKLPEDVPTLSSGTVKKVYDIINTALPVAKEWGYINEVPNIKAPVVKYKKRHYWSSMQVCEALSGMTNPLLHLAVHLSFICALRPGEVVGIDIKNLDLENKSLWISQTLQRVSKDALEIISKHEIIRVFSSDRASTSSLIAKTTKTENSDRTALLTDPIVDEIKCVIAQIDKNKQYFGSDYNDYGLLFSQVNGNPIEPTLMEKWFRNWQKNNGIENVLDMQGLRKSSQMYKIRISNYDYQTVASLGGHSLEVMLKNYDQSLETEKKELMLKIQEDFYTEVINAGDSRIYS